MKTFAITCIGIVCLGFVGCARGSDDLTADVADSAVVSASDSSVDATASMDASIDVRSTVTDAAVNCEYLGGDGSGDPGTYRFSEDYVCDGRMVVISCDCAQQTCSCDGKNVDTQCENGVYTTVAVRTTCGINIRPPGAGSK